MEKRFLFFALALFMAIIPLAAEKIILAADPWEPYNGEPDSSLPGFAVEMAKEIFEKAGYEFEYVVQPWSRAVSNASEGSVDGVIAALKDDAPDLIFPEEEINYQQDTFYVLKSNSWRFSGRASLNSINLGTVMDYAYSDVVTDFIESNGSPKVQPVGGEDPLATNVRKLQGRRIDALIEDKNVMDYYLSKNGLTGSIIPAGETGSGPLYIAFSPKNPNSSRYAQIFDAGVREMRSSGRLAQILSRYGLSDWK